MHERNDFVIPLTTGLNVFIGKSNMRGQESPYGFFRCSFAMFVAHFVLTLVAHGKVAEKHARLVAAN
jgi:hypothetical protein